MLVTVASIEAMALNRGPSQRQKQHRENGRAVRPFAVQPFGRNFISRCELVVHLLLKALAASQCTNDVSEMSPIQKVA